MPARTDSETTQTKRELPRRIQLLKWGVNDSTEGPVIVNERTVEAFAATQRKIGRERAPLDFEHNTVAGTPEFLRTQEPRAIAAMGTPVVIPGSGLFLECLNYTPQGESFAAHYEDVSAAPLMTQDGVVVGLHSAALTRSGAVYGAHFSAEDILKLAGEGVRLGSFSAKFHPASNDGPVVRTTQTKDKIMPDITIESLSKQLAELTASIDQRLKALEGQKPMDITPLSSRLDALEKSSQSAAQAAIATERAKIVPLFASEGRAPVNPETGKAYTLDELNAMDVPTLRVLHANTPKSVPLTPGAKAADGKSATQLSGAARTAAAWSGMKK
jgi:hypothetical protein